MTKTTIISAAITLAGGSTAITTPSVDDLSGAINYGQTAAIGYASVFGPSGVGVDLTNQSTVILSGSVTGVGADPNLATGFGGYTPFLLAGAIDLYGVGSTFVNSGTVGSNFAETVVSAGTNATSLLVFQTDGVFENSGLLTNKASGTIAGNGTGVYLSNGGGLASTLINSGTITGLGFTGNDTVAGSGTVVGSVVTYTTFGSGAEVGEFENAPDVINTVQNFGVMLGAPGLYLRGQSTVLNDGTIGGIGNINNAYVTLTGNPFFNGVAIYGGQSNSITDGYSVDIKSTPTITNNGLIESAATTGSGIFLFSGVVTNETQGSIVGYNGAVIFKDLGTLINSGTINGGAFLDQAGTITNMASAVIESGHTGVGVYLDGGTLINAGSIVGTTDSVQFGISGGTVIVDPGAVFVGSIAATSALDVIAFAAPASGGAISLSDGYGVGALDFSNASSVTIDGDVSQLASGAQISGLSKGDTINLAGFAATGDSFVSGVGLELFSGASTITLDIQGNFATSDFSVSDPPTETTIGVNADANPCFAAGTYLLTPEGAVAVESLGIGNHVVCHGGTSAPIIWIGRRKLNLLNHPRPEAVRPILIEPGAICDGVPQRTLLVSPDHAIYLDGYLIPAKALMNGTTIRQITQPSVTYFHVELSRHAVLYAEGCPVESYLETGNRGAFDNGAKVMTLHPDFAQRLREATGCAPFAEAGEVVEAVRARLLSRAAIQTTMDPALSIERRRDGVVVVASRGTIPGHISPDPRDRRHLGVKVAAITCANGTTIPLDHADLVTGWHDPEPDGRWTNGYALIPASLVGDGLPHITLAATLAYPIDQKLVAKAWLF